MIGYSSRLQGRRSRTSEMVKGGLLTANFSEYLRGSAGPPRYNPSRSPFRTRARSTFPVKGIL